MRPAISVAAATGLSEAISAAGADPDPVLRSVGLHPSVLSNAEKFIPCSIFARLLEEAARAASDNYFGLHFGERFNPKNIGPLTYIVLNSPTVGVADQHVARFLKLYNQAAKTSSSITGDYALMEYVLCDLGIGVPRHQNEYSMVVRLNTIRMMVGSQWTPVEVQFAHEAPEQTAEHERIFGAPVLFGYATNNLVVEREFLERQIPAADPRLYEIMRQYLEEVLEEMPQLDDLLTSVRRAIAETLRDGEPALARVAKKMAMSPRTLQRQLNERGIRFKNFLDDTRRRFAQSYLKDRKNTLTEVAFLLGYSEASAFNRAFKRWTGATPLAYRHRTVHALAMGESVRAEC
jgi:AraC-like DNA-binding protein